MFRPSFPAPDSTGPGGSRRTSPGPPTEPPPIPTTIDETHARALALFTAGQQREALVLLFETLGYATPAERASPAMAPLRRLLASLLDTVAISMGNETIVGVLVSLANDPAVPPQSLAPSLLAMLTGSAAASALRSPAASVVTDGARDLLEHPLVPALLPRIVVGSRDGESLCACWRQALLHRALDPVFLTQPWLWNGIGWLSAAALNGEYVWPEDAEESALVQSLAEALTASLAAAPIAGAVDGALAPLLLAFAMYRPLASLPGWEELAEIPAVHWGALGPAMTSLLQRQVHDPLDERRRAAQLPQLSLTGHDASQRVQAQYETHPYPRWISPPSARATSIAALVREWRPHGPLPDINRVLIAGCGTGRQAAHLALSLPDAEITAIDLSRASLGYASRMLEACGITTVRLLQGDLLALDALDTTFAVISCSGVLHHLETPRAGWAQLVRRLAPGGIMKIGLYSTLARGPVQAARALITANGLPTTDDALRAARRQLLALPPTHPAAAAMDSLDAYALSGFRDLVAHVQERTYTLDELAADLDALHLEFLGFQLPRDVQARFTAANPHPGAARDLDAWAQFEAAHPTTFWGMYQFWCAGREG